MKFLDLEKYNNLYMGRPKPVNVGTFMFTTVYHFHIKSYCSVANVQFCLNST